MEQESLRKALERYMHPKIVSGMLSYIIKHKVMVKITPPRSTKLGDYRNPRFNGQHQITVNGNLNPHAFAVTFLHEMAHLLCYEAFKRKVKPHGPEWKSFFTNLSKPYLGVNIFPADVEIALQDYFTNPAASSCADPNLYKVLNSYDEQAYIYVEDLELGSKFILENGRSFEKGEKQRTRFLCRCLQTKKLYSVSGVAKIKRLI